MFPKISGDPRGSEGPNAAFTASPSSKEPMERNINFLIYKVRNLEIRVFLRQLKT